MPRVRRTPAPSPSLLLLLLPPLLLPLLVSPPPLPPLSLPLLLSLPPPLLVSPLLPLALSLLSLLTLLLAQLPALLALLLAAAPAPATPAVASPPPLLVLATTFGKIARQSGALSPLPAATHCHGKRVRAGRFATAWHPAVLYLRPGPEGRMGCQSNRQATSWGEETAGQACGSAGRACLAGCTRTCRDSSTAEKRAAVCAASAAPHSRDAGPIHAGSSSAPEWASATATRGHVEWREVRGGTDPIVSSDVQVRVSV